MNAFTISAWSSRLIFERNRMSSIAIKGVASGANRASSLSKDPFTHELASGSAVKELDRQSVWLKRKLNVARELPPPDAST
jgi:hypothetical protein